MKSLLTCVALTCVFAIGCANKKQAAAIPSDSAVTDIAPAPAPAPVAWQPPPQPVFTETPVVPTSSASGGKYIVKKGDTLWGIAQRTYGDGRQYTRIVSANPGVSPQSLKIGQTLVIP